MYLSHTHTRALANTKKAIEIVTVVINQSRREKDKKGTNREAITFIFPLTENVHTYIPDLELPACPVNGH